MIELDEGPVTQRTTKGPPLYYASAMPKGGAKAVLGMIPGYADHGARYAHVMGALAEHGIGSVVIDLRGHGRAGGMRGYCTRFGEFLDDVKELRRLLDARAKGVPQFLFGHSFGGLTAATSVLSDPSPWKGLVLSAPFFGLAMDVPRVKIVAGKIASRVYPKLQIPSGIPSKDLTHDTAKAKAYDDDPLVFKNATARWFTEATKAQGRALENASRLSMPLYMVFGTLDRVASFPTGKRFFDAAGSKDKTWDPRDGLFHEVLNEPSWKEIVDPIAAWLTGHLQ
jgi:alpha-beta hydrolase superfamily lysophospholipase